MGQVFYRLYYHLVWGTKNREPQLVKAVQPVLLEAIEEKCRRLECRLHARNAVEDHVHVALEIPPSKAVAFVAGQLKGVVSHEVNQRYPCAVDWQDGYGVVTFRASELEKVKQYVATQEERHRLGKLSEILERWEEPEES